MTDPTNPDGARSEPEEPEPNDTPGDAEAQVEAILAAIGAEDALRELDERAGTDDGDGRGASQATRLVELARRQFRTVLGGDGKTYAVQLSGPNLALSLRGENGLRTRLARAFFDETQTAPGASALADALNVLEGQAVDTEPEPVALRVAKHDGALILDLGLPDGRAVVITPGEWHVEPEPPVLFRRTRLTSPLPIPDRDGDGLDRLRALLNVGESGFRLLVAWLVAALFPDIPHPILALSGEQGTAKSTTGRSLVCLIDPSPAPLRAAPKDQRAWTVQAAASWTVMLDNVSSIPAWFSDTLCKAVTGDGIVDRALYTDDDVVVLTFRRVLSMTTIDAGAMAGDLAERLMILDLELIDPARRRTEGELDAAFARDRPAILAALLDLLAAVLATLPAIELDDMPRMADFAQVLAALDACTGWATLPAYAAAAQNVSADALEGDVFGAAVLAFLEKVPRWSGTAAMLLDLLPQPEGFHPTWPKDATRVGGKLKRLAPLLRAAGVTIDDSQRTTDRHRRRLLTLCLETPCAPVSAAPAVSANGSDQGQHGGH